MSEQTNQIPLEILRGRRANLDSLSLKDGSMEFAYDTGGLFFDVADQATNRVQRIQVSTNRLVQTSNNDGTLIINELSFDQVNNKLDKVTDIPENHVVLAGPGGTLIDSNKTIDEIGTRTTVLFTEVVLESDNWVSVTKTQVVPCPDVLANSTIIVSPKEPEKSTQYNIYCSNQANSQLTFKYLDSQPREDITFYVVIYENIPEDENFTRVIRTAALNPDEWTGIGDTQRFHDDGIKIGSVITVSPVNVEEAISYNIYASEQGVGYIDFKYQSKPEVPINFYVLIENYS